MNDQPTFAEYPRPNHQFGRGPGVYFEAIGEAWDLVRKDLGHWIAATIVYFVVYYAISLPIGLIVGPMMPRGLAGARDGQIFAAVGLQLLLSIVPLSVQFVMGVGMITMGVRKARGEYINVGMMFEPFRRFGTVAATGLLYYLIVVAASLALVLPVFFFAPVLVLMPTVAYMLRVRPIEALSLTFNACKGHWAGLLGLCVVLYLISLAGLLACCVGILFAWPIVCVVLAIHYRAFFESEPAPAIPTYG